MTTAYNINANYTLDVYDNNSNYITTLDFPENSSLSQPGAGDPVLPTNMVNIIKTQFESFLSVVLNIRSTLQLSS
jgi:hypothetical protein